MALIDSLVAYWKLEEASGSRADSFGANTLTDNNTVTQAAGKIGSAAQHTRANTETLSAASSAALQTGDISFTFVVWVWLDTEANFMVILSKDGNGTPAGSREYVLYYNPTSDRFIFQVFRATDVEVSVVADNFGAVSTGTWAQVGAYHDAATDTNGIWVNNGTANTTATGGALQAASSNAFAVGGRLLAGSGNLPWDGRLDEVGFWKRLLTAAEKTFLYNGGAGMAYPFAIGPIQELSPFGSIRQVVTPPTLMRASTR